MINIKLKRSEGAKEPEYQSTGSAGADIFSFIENEITIAAGETALVNTGLYLEIPDGYEVQIRPRSGLALKHGITLLNSPGTIDSDYRGELKIIVTNLGKEPFTIFNHMRIAQMIVSRVYRANFCSESSLTETGRGSGGFGHTGI
ncbi:MAG: dUTP diphosphatase [Spirochaetes bacterium]|jgi:dUTP pyrophosphatase|nr:dUTP diphosphatase [Spirochaetota bacterium]